MCSTNVWCVRVCLSRRSSQFSRLVQNETNTKKPSTFVPVTRVNIYRARLALMQSDNRHIHASEDGRQKKKHTHESDNLSRPMCTHTFWFPPLRSKEWEMRFKYIALGAVCSSTVKSHHRICAASVFRDAAKGPDGPKIHYPQMHAHTHTHSHRSYPKCSLVLDVWVNVWPRNTSRFMMRPQGPPVGSDFASSAHMLSVHARVYVCVCVYGNVCAHIDDDDSPLVVLGG